MNAPSGANYALYGLRTLTAAGTLDALYGLDWDRFDAYGVASFEHQGCVEGEYCRNPLHPGPCKGWKHTLHAVAPGAFHAYEKARVDKLNQRRLARIDELKKAGKPIPKHLLKEHAYLVPTVPQAGYTPPTPEQAKEALTKAAPATAKEIGAKIAQKHADIAAKKAAEQALPPGAHLVKNAPKETPGLTPLQHKMLVESGHLESNPHGAKDYIAQTHARNAGNIERAAATHELINTPAPKTQEDLAAVAEKFGMKMSHPLANGHGGWTAHIDNGNHAGMNFDSQKGWSHSGGTVGLTLGLKNGQVSNEQAMAYLNRAKDDHYGDESKVASLAKEDLANHAQFGPEAHLLPAPKVEMPSVGPQHGTLMSAADAIMASPLTDAKKKAILTKMQALSDEMKPGEDIANHPTVQATINNLVFAAMPTKGTAKTKAALHDKLVEDLTEHVSEGKPGIPELLQKTIDGQNAKPKISVAAQKASKVTHELAHPDMMAAYDQAKGPAVHHQSVINALEKPGVNKAEFEKLGDSGQQKIIQALAYAQATHPQAVQSIAHKLGVEQDVELMHPASTGGVAPKFHPASVADQGLPPHLKAISDAVLGKTHWSDTKKMVELNKTSGADFAKLDPATQKKTLDSLQAMKSKFLSPAKKNQADILLSKFGPIHAGPKIEPQAHVGEVTPHQKALAHEAVKVLATGEGLHGGLESVAKSHEAAPEKMVHEAAQGLSSAWAFTHGLHGNPNLTAEDLKAIKDKAEAEMAQMIKTGATKPPAGGVLDLAKDAKEVGTGDAGKANLLKKAAGIQPTSLGASVDEHAAGYYKALDAAAELSGTDVSSITHEHVKGTLAKPGAVDTMTQFFADTMTEQWLKKHDAITAHLTTEQFSELKKRVNSELKAMINDGSDKPVPGGILDTVHKDEGLGNHSATANSVKSLLATPGASGPHGAGAGGDATSGKGAVPDLSTFTPDQQAALHHAAYVAVSQLSGGQGTKTSKEDIKKAMDDGTFDAMAEKMATGIGKLWAKEHVSATAPEKEAAVGEIKHMIANGLANPPAGGILSQYAPVGAPQAKSSSMQPGTVEIGNPAAGVIGASKMTIVPDENGAFHHQVILESHAAEVAQFNQHVKGAKKGDDALATTPSITKIRNGELGDKLGNYSKSSVANALTTYSGSSYQGINGYMRALDKDPNHPKNASQDKIVNAIKAAMDHAVLKEAVVVYRGTSTGKKTFGPHFSMDHSMAGAEISASGFVSTSTSRGVAQGFAGYGGSGMVMRIVAPKGSKAVCLRGGSTSHEDELLFPPGTKLRVVADNGYQDGYRQLDLEVVAQ